MKKTKTLHCYSFRTDRNGNGYFQYHIVTVRETERRFILACNSRSFPDGTRDINKNELDNVFEFFTNECEFYLISERDNIMDNFKQVVRIKLFVRAEELENRLKRFRKALIERG